MKKPYALFFILLISFGLFSCKSSQKNKDVKNGEQKTDSVLPTSSVVVTDSNNYRFTISFYSKGAGIDYKMKEKYLNFIKEFEQKKGITLAYSITSWGKEGETDFCFRLLGLTVEEQNQFVADSKTLLKESTLVNIGENMPCRNNK